MDAYPITFPFLSITPNSFLAVSVSEYDANFIFPGFYKYADSTRGEEGAWEIRGRATPSLRDDETLRRYL